MQDVCFGAIAGLKFSANAATEGTANSICIPATATSAQSVSVVVRYLRNHPERLHEEFPFLVMDAFSDAWPCKRR